MMRKNKIKGRTTAPSSDAVVSPARKAIVINETMANRIYDVLVKHVGANESGREDFIFQVTQPPEYFDWSDGEYRFQGLLGYGGKFIYTQWAWTVDYCPEDETFELDKLVKRANSEIAAIRNAN